MNLYPLWIFLSFSYHRGSQSRRTGQLTHEYHSGSNWIFQFSRDSTLGGWQVLLDPAVRFGCWYCGVICQWSLHRTGLGIFGISHGRWGSGICWWVSMSSISASDKAFPKPSKTSCSSKVVYFPMHHLNSLTLIAKGQGSLGAGGLASSDQYWSACT